MIALGRVSLLIEHALSITNMAILIVMEMSMGQDNCPTSPCRGYEILTSTVVTVYVGLYVSMLLPWQHKTKH